MNTIICTNVMNLYNMVGSLTLVCKRRENYFSEIHTHTQLLMPGNVIMLIRANVIGLAIALQCLVIESKVTAITFCAISYLLFLSPSHSFHQFCASIRSFTSAFLFVGVYIFLEEYFHILAHLTIVIDPYYQEEISFLLYMGGCMSVTQGIFWPFWYSHVQ